MIQHQTLSLSQHMALVDARVLGRGAAAPTYAVSVANPSWPSANTNSLVPSMRACGLDISMTTAAHHATEGFGTKPYTQRPKESLR